MSPRMGDSRQAAPPSVSQNPPLFFRGGRGPLFPRCTPLLLWRAAEKAAGQRFFKFKKAQDALTHTNLKLTALPLLQWQNNGSICRKSELNKDVPQQRKTTGMTGTACSLPREPIAGTIWHFTLRFKNKTHTYKHICYLKLGLLGCLRRDFCYIYRNNPTAINKSNVLRKKKKRNLQLRPAQANKLILLSWMKRLDVLLACLPTQSVQQG